MAKKRNLINFWCIHCEIEFDFDVGKINFETEDGSPEYQNAIICRQCGVKYVGKVDNFSDNFELTEIGQSQLTELMFSTI